MVGRLQAEGITWYCTTMTSALGLNNPAQGWDLTTFPDFLATGDNGPRIDVEPNPLNEFFRKAGLLDGVFEFDQATIDAGNGTIHDGCASDSRHTDCLWSDWTRHITRYTSMRMAPVSSSCAL